MHPATSVILFTSLSGLGFGMLFWLGLGFPDVIGWSAFAFFAVAFTLSVGGLLASTFHLGHPERFLKAFTQWKSSWLSREAVIAVCGLTVMGLYAAGAVFLGETFRVLGVIGAILSVLTVYATAMIYTQLKTVPRWNQPTTPAIFLLLSVSGGALMTNQLWAALPLFVVAIAVQLLAWKRGDRALANSGTDIGTATGLGDRGTVRPFEPPHTGNNYLMREMVHVIGRKHAMKLRVIAIALLAAPLFLLFIPSPGHVIGAVAVLLHLAGVVTLRWLFFAEAEHVVGIYYGKR